MRSEHSRRAFFTVVTAQFFSAIADNALLIAAIGLLLERHAASWMAPALRFSFYGSYLLLAAFVGTLADTFPKNRVVIFTNLVKLGGCILMLTNVHPLAAYALVGIGAAAYIPAKYGILPELLPPSALVKANAWMEALTVLSILLGVLVGSLLMDKNTFLPQMASTSATNAIAYIALIYSVAVLCSWAIPKISASADAVTFHPYPLARKFAQAFVVLWCDRDSKISLAVTSIFWATAAALQFIVLNWARQYLHLPLSQAALLQGAIAVGTIIGAVASAHWVPLRSALSVLPVGVAVGMMLLLMTFITTAWIAALMMVVIGTMSGLLLVPMNALLQHRGKLLMHPGQAIAVQNFNENLASLVFLAIYGLLLYMDVSVLAAIAGFGLFVLVIMLLITIKHRSDRRRS